jgi:hypothetical protein
VYVPGRGWVISRELQEGDELLESAGGTSTVIAARYERHPRGILVYNFRVSESHTYFVRERDSKAEPVWVHNACDIGDAAESGGSSLIPPSASDIQAVTDAINANAKDVGIGLVDTQTGQIYLSPASTTPSHLDLASKALGIEDIDDATDLRGFTLGNIDGQLQFANNPSLNPLNNQMEPQLFENVKAALSSAFGLNR